MILQELFEAEQTPAQKYIQDVYSQYQDWPYGKGDKVMVWGSGEDQQLAPFALTTDILDKNTVVIDWLQAVPQRQGVGRRAMTELQRKAQEHGVRLKLMPWNKGQVSQAALKRIYKKMGFKPTSKGADLMAWSPEQLDEISDERLQQYLDRARHKIDSRMNRMAQARDRLNKGYEIYHAETPNKVVDRFEARTPAEAQRYYNNFIANYESDRDYDLRLRRATGLSEAFNQPYPITWETGDYGSYDALARLDDGSNLSINFNLESAGPEGMDEEWQVEFWRNNSLAVTGEGDAYKIFATVLEAIEQFIGEENPERVAFSASKDVEPGQNAQSRAKLYDRMVQRYAAGWGYNVTRREAGDAVNYELTRKDELNKGLYEATDFTNAVNSVTKIVAKLPRKPKSVEQLVPMLKRVRFLQAQHNDERFLTDLAQAVLKRLSINEINDDDELSVSQRIQDYFTSRGYGYLGEGRDQIAFLSPRGTVVKVLGIGDDDREDIVKTYVGFFLRNQRNPHYPRIYNAGDFTVDGETYFVYEMEYLHPVSGEEQVLEYIEDLMGSINYSGQRGIDAFRKNRPLPPGLSEEQVDGLVYATQDLEDAIGGQAPLDLRSIENLGRRKDGQIVIIDPFSL